MTNIVDLIVAMIWWRRYTKRKFSLLHADEMTSTPSELLFATRDCVVISNDAGGGEQDTTMTDEKWQRSVPIPHKDIPGESPTTSSSSGNSISKPRAAEERKTEQQKQMGNHSQNHSPLVRAQSPVISAFIDRRLEALRTEYPNIDSIQVFADEGGCVSRVSLNSFCSYQPKEEEYTLERLKQAGPEFQKFAGLLEVLATDEEEGVDLESEVVHTGLTQTQTETGTQSQSQGAGPYF